jgi:hypothetical protein
MSKHTNMSSQSSVSPVPRCSVLGCKTDAYGTYGIDNMPLCEEHKLLQNVCDDCSMMPKDCKCEADEWEEVYNSTDERQGEPREHCGQPGTFYQTYGNGGGENGWGGYWVRKDTTAVWTVAGQVFKYLDNYILEYKPCDSMAGKVAKCRVYVPKPENPTCCMCSKTCENEWGNNPAPLATKGVCCNECNQKVLLVRMGMLKINKDGEYEFIPMKVKLGRVGRLGED